MEKCRVHLPETRKIVWRGMGTKRLPDYVTRPERDQLVNEVVAATLENFPPK